MTKQQEEKEKLPEETSDILNDFLNKKIEQKEKEEKQQSN